jgi:glucosylceramidase
MKLRIALLTGLLAGSFVQSSLAQSFEWVCSTEGNTWNTSTIKADNKSMIKPSLEVAGNENIIMFKAWGTCFNELGWDALNILPEQSKEDIIKKLFSKDGDLRFSMGRIPMNANDYARDWYSCDEVNGDFQLKYFNIERDKTTLIPFIKAAQKYNSDLYFWISPWSPPSWMKINNYYSVRSNSKYNKMDPKSDIALYEGSSNKDTKVFPQQLAVNDYFIQDPRYLKAYAEYFCKFIDAYKEQGIPVKTAMFQNESWSYTDYPGCAWTPEGIIRFNSQYLGPQLRKRHPDVSLYFGTINSNRFDFIDEVLSDTCMLETVKGVGFQWEGGQILPRIRSKYPQLKYVQTESECGWGSFDWKAAEHTFGLINHYLGNGCEEYTFWNAILSDDGVSGWGWKQNALIRVDSKSKTVTYTPEYYAVKHYSKYIGEGSKIMAFRETGNDKLPVMVVMTPDNKYVVLAGNYNKELKQVSVKLGKKYLNLLLPGHSLNTFRMK